MITLSLLNATLCFVMSAIFLIKNHGAKKTKILKGWNMPDTFSSIWYISIAFMVITIICLIVQYLP